MNDLSLKSVSKRFGGLDAVCNINLDIAHGERRALIGPNGAGKTTLFNLIAGDLPVTAGRIYLFGKDVTKMSIQGRVGMGLRRTYQTSAVFPSLTLAQNLYLGILGPKRRGHLNVIRVASKDHHINQRIAELAEMIGLHERLESRASDLSHGETRQLELGLSIAVNPRFVMLDEPAAGLSPAERLDIIRLLKSLESNVTLMIIEHDMDVALSVANQITVLHEGNIVAEGSPDGITGNPLVQEIYLGNMSSTH
jgi:branched-chain amino acid transport system ATP-binding protein